MISLSELNPKSFQTTSEIDANLADLLVKVNRVRSAYAAPMTVTSGFRSLADHKRIYMEKAAKIGIKNPRIPMGSKHLTGQAVDISDSSGRLMNWCKENEALLTQVGLWCEELDDQKRVHFQSVPPISGKRFFKP